MRQRPIELAVLTGALAFAFALSCRLPLPNDDAIRIQRVVGDFYTWYRPMLDIGEAPMRAIRERPALFSPTVVTALRAASVARANSPDEVVGLDGDPFLNAQDFCDRYQPVRTTPHSTLYWVEIVGSGRCGTHRTPDVIVEVSVHGDSIRFENFVYSTKADDNLMSILRQLSQAKTGALAATTPP